MRKVTHTCLCPLLLLSALSLNLSHAQEPPNNAFEEDNVRILVGFDSWQDEERFVRARKTEQMNRGLKRKSKIKYQFKQTKAIAMEVTKAELEAMKQDSAISYIEEDPIVHRASFSTLYDETSTQQHLRNRLLQEDTSYGLRKIQGDASIPLPTSSSGDCAINICIVDSGLSTTHYDIPYGSDQIYIKGAEFGMPEGQRWNNPNPGNNDHGTGVAVSFQLHSCLSPILLTKLIRM